MPGICPVCQKPYPAGTSICPRPACARPPALFAAATSAQPNNLFELATMVPQATPISALPAAAVALPAPETFRIPGYEVLSVVGRGGMGLVLEARQVSLERRVAIKVLPRELSGSTDFVARFEREAVALARLSHPHIVGIYDRGRAEGLLYFVMEFVPGPSNAPADLRSLIAARVLDESTTHRLILQVTRALDHAHGQGIIHRDVKPGNVLIDRQGNAKVTDFGIAAVQVGGGRGRQLTRLGSGLGTLHYMAPEQHRDAASIDGRADVYSAGVMLYEMLSGRLPANPEAKPSQAVSGLHSAWDCVVGRALKPRAEDRYPSMAAFVADLERFTPVAATPRPSQPVAAPAEAIPLCLGCAAPLGEKEEYCGGCGLPTRPLCPHCETPARPGVAFCGRCGLNLAHSPRFEAAWEQGHRLAGAARREESPIEERCLRADEAAAAFQTALQLYPESGRARSALNQMATLASELLLQTADRAGQAKDYATAGRCFSRLVQRHPGHSRAVKGLADLTALREKGLAEADAHRGGGRLQACSQVLEKLARYFPDDGQVRGRLEQARAEQRDVQEFTSKRLPTLKEARRFAELGADVAALRQRGVSLGGLDKLSTQIEERLSRADALVARGREVLAKSPVQARNAARKALELVSDHAGARRLLAEAGGPRASAEMPLIETTPSNPAAPFLRGLLLGFVVFAALGGASLAGYAFLGR